MPRSVSKMATVFFSTGAIEPYAIGVVGLHPADLRKRKREGPLRAKALFRPDLSEQGSKRFGLWSLLRVNLSAERRKHGGCNGELCGHLPNILPARTRASWLCTSPSLLTSRSRTRSTSIPALPPSCSPAYNNPLLGVHRKSPPVKATGRTIPLYG